MLRGLLAAGAALLLGTQAVASLDGAPPGEAMFTAWAAKPQNASRVAEFEGQLERQGLLNIVPTYQLLRTALSWKGCKAEPFELPSRDRWQGAFNSLETLRDDIIPAIGPVEIVSGYRHEHLNRCAGGASRSVHREFGAFDGYAVGNLTRAEMIQRLCGWHNAKGGDLKAGLGIYRGKKFHLDVGLRGNRRWGSDYSGRSSPCNARGSGVTAAAK
ncbi:MAG: D-Ala-D-Ala carboxypeptidase family metallohydrolase [Pacificimonas sp.]